MPKHNAQEHRVDVAYPITAAEVRVLIEVADKRGVLVKQLETDAYEALATWLSGVTTEGRRRQWEPLKLSPDAMTEADAKYLLRWREAASLLKRTPEHRNSFPAAFGFEEAAELLAESVSRAELLLSARQPQRRNPQEKEWVWTAVWIAFSISEVFREAGGRGGTGRNTVAVKFTQLALERIGWRDKYGRPIKRSAIASYCEKVDNPSPIDRNRT